MWAELKTLFWLQGKLTLSMFRNRRAGERLRALLMMVQFLTFVSSIPFFIAMGAGLALVSILLLSPQAAYEMMMLVNTLMFFTWLILPASYNSQIVERFEMSRLFAYPIHFRSIVVGSTAISLFTMTGIWSACILVGEIVGLAWHQPLALPLILLGSLPAFALLVLTGRVMDDLFDLVAGDRRLRGLVLALMTLPFMLIGVGQAFIQNAIRNYEQIEFLQKLPVQDVIAQLEGARDVSEFFEILRPSRLLVWLPPGWVTSGMGLSATGAWGKGFLFVLVSFVGAGLLLWMHVGITRRLMQGAALGLGAERVRTRGSWFAGKLPGPPAFWALLRKDWTYLWRSPGPRRIVFSALMSILPMSILLGQQELQAEFGEAVFLVVGMFVLAMMSMIVNLGLMSNYFGMMDREGFGTLSASPIDRRQIIVAANVVTLCVACVMYGVVFVLLAVFTHFWEIMPLGLCLGLCLQIGGSPIYTLAAIIGPYRTQLKYSSGTRQRGNMWGMLAWLISAIPMILLLVLPYFLWKPALMVTVPLSFAYSAGIYVLTLKPLAKLLQRREHTILEAVAMES